MQIRTIWQPSYTPPTVAPKEPRKKMEWVRSKPPVKRAYLRYDKSKTAKMVLDAINERDGVTVSDLIGITKLTGVCHYIKTLEMDGLIKCALLPVPHATQRVKHYW